MYKVIIKDGLMILWKYGLKDSEQNKRSQVEEVTTLPQVKIFKLI